MREDGAERADVEHRAPLDAAAQRLALDKKQVVAFAAITFVGGMAAAMAYTLRRKPPMDAVAPLAHTARSPAEHAHTHVAQATHAPAHALAPRSSGPRIVDVRTQRPEASAPAPSTPVTTASTANGAAADAPAPLSEAAKQGPMAIFREMNAAIFSAFRSSPASPSATAPASGGIRALRAARSPAPGAPASSAPACAASRSSVYRPWEASYGTARRASHRSTCLWLDEDDALSSCSVAFTSRYWPYRSLHGSLTASSSCSMRDVLSDTPRNTRTGTCASLTARRTQPCACRASVGAVSTTPVAAAPSARHAPSAAIHIPRASMVEGEATSPRTADRRWREEGGHSSAAAMAHRRGAHDRCNLHPACGKFAPDSIKLMHLQSDTLSVRPPIHALRTPCTYTWPDLHVATRYDRPTGGGLHWPFVSLTNPLFSFAKHRVSRRWALETSPATKRRPVDVRRCWLPAP